MNDLGLVYGDRRRVDARWPLLASVPPLFGVYVEDESEPLHLFALRVEAEAYARGEGLYWATVEVRSWHPRH